MLVQFADYEHCTHVLPLRLQYIFLQNRKKKQNLLNQWIIVQCSSIVCQETLSYSGLIIKNQQYFSVTLVRSIYSFVVV